MRRTLRLLPLPLCIGMSLAHAAENRPVDWRLCPIQDAVPAFPDAPAPEAQTGAAAESTAPAGQTPTTGAATAASTGEQSTEPQVSLEPTPETGPPKPAPTPEARAQQPTDIAGDQLGGTDENPQFHGNVVLRRADQFLGANNLDYQSETGRYVAEGAVRYQDSGMRMVADRAEGDQNTDTHNIQNVRYQLISRRGNGGAEHIEMQGAQGALYGATYSTCPPDDRHWELRAQRIDVDTDEGTGVARNAVLRVGHVPVLYVPWFPFPIDNRRRSGLLSPSIGLSGRNGFDYRQPYYFNLAPNYDATLIPRLMTDRGLQLGGEFRYLTETGRGVFFGTYLPNDKLTDRDRQEEIDDHVPPDNRRADDRALFHFAGFQNLNDTWQARAQLNWISDPRYLEDFNNKLDSSTAFEITSTIGVFGHGRYWDASLTGNYHQLADYTLSERGLPFNRLPRAYVSWEQPLGRFFSAGVDAEAVRFQDPVQPGGSRVDFKPYISMPLEGASWFVTPTLAWRYTGYQVDEGLADQVATNRATAYALANGLLENLTAVQRRAVIAGLAPQFYNDRPSRSVPIASLDAGLYFDREFTWHGDSFLQTLEPRMFYLRVPYRDQSEIPLFDTRPMTFSWGQLFRDNRYTGADRQTDANQLTFALTSRLLRQSDGREKLTVSLGQIKYLDASRVVSVRCRSPNVPANCETPVDRGGSAWVADSTWQINDRWSVGGSYQWDPKFRRQDLASARARYLIGDEGVANLSYRYRRNLLEQVDLSFLYPITPAWSLVGRYYYSLYRNATHEPQLLEAIAGVQWDSCCIAMRLVERRYIHNRQGELNNALQLEIEFKGLGSAGPDTERRLRRAILGYYREDLYLVPPTGFDGSGDDDNSPDMTP